MDKKVEENQVPIEAGEEEGVVEGVKLEKVPTKASVKPKNPLLANRGERKYFDSADWEMNHQKK